MPLPTNKQKHVRKIGQFQSTSGHQPMMIDTVGPLTKLRLRLSYTYTPDATNDATGVLFQQNIRFLQNVTMVVQGRDTVWNVTPAIYAARRQYENKGVPMKGMETTISGTHATSATNVDVTMSMHFDLVNGRKRDDAALDLRGLTSAQLGVTFGTTDAADLWTTKNGTISSAVATVEAEYIVNANPKDVYVTRTLDEIQQPITASNTNFSFDIDARTGLAIRTLMFVFTKNNIGDDTLCAVTGGQIDLASGAYHFVTTEPGHLKADVRDEMSIPSAQELAGVDFLDLMQFGKLSTTIPTGRLDANLKATLNVTYGTGTAQVIVQRESTRPLQI